MLYFNKQSLLPYRCHNCVSLLNVFWMSFYPRLCLKIEQTHNSDNWLEKKKKAQDANNLMSKGFCAISHSIILLCLLLCMCIFVLSVLVSCFSRKKKNRSYYV